MKITLCGSIHYLEAMRNTAKTLESLGYEVATPANREEATAHSNLSETERADLKSKFIRKHLDKITESDAILVFNKERKGIEGYVGGNTLMEMAFAYAQHLEIFLLNPIPDLSYSDEIQGMKPIVVDGRVEAIDEYCRELPKTYVSSKSPIKLRAVSRGMRRAGIRTNVLPHPTESGVHEEPQNIEETYQGAQNRHEQLKRETAGSAAAYLATIESGLFHVHPQHNVFDSSVVILEKSDGVRKVGMNLGLEYPKEMTDKVPSQYPDLGVLVQKEYGSQLKDPFPFFTNNKVKRQELVEDAIYNVAVQLPVE